MDNIIVKPSETLLEWDAPERMFKKRTREFYRKIAIIIIFFALLLLIIKEFLLIVVLGIVFFVVYVFHTVPPRVIHHKVTTNGLDYASLHLYRWDELESFFIEKKEDTHMLVINTKNPLPGRILLLLDERLNQDKVTKVLNEYISIVENPEVGVLDKIMAVVGKRMNI